MMTDHPVHTISFRRFGSSPYEGAGGSSSIWVPARRLRSTANTNSSRNRRKNGTEVLNPVMLSAKWA